MLKHTHSDPTNINFAKLEERLLQVNTTSTLASFTSHLTSLLENVPTLIMATGGSKPSAYFLKMFLEKYGVICEVIEPRDYFYKPNINAFQKLVVLSNSGKSNGLIEALESFPGKSFLITGEYPLEKKDNSFNTLYWSNTSYLDNKEKSFISIIPTLAPMLMCIELNILIEERKESLSKDEYEKINEKLKRLIARSKEKIAKLNFNFKDTNQVQVMTGYDTISSASIIESSLVETGIASVTLHDKGSYCHGRSNLLFQNPESPIVYLLHNMTDLDQTIIDVLTKEYPNIFPLSSFDERENILWKELYLSLQMYFLAKKIASDKDIELTMPEYNPNVVRKLYTYKGGM